MPFQLFGLFSVPEFGTPISGVSPVPRLVSWCPAERDATLEPEIETQERGTG